MEDEKIVELFFARSEFAIEATAQKYGKYCKRIAMNVLGCDEDVRECVNDAYLAAWNSIPPNRPEILSVFIGRITRNIALKKLRAARAEKRGGGQTALVLEELGECLPCNESVSAQIEAKELAALISDFLNKLDSIERSVFVLRCWYFESIADISRRFGFSQSKVKSMLHRTRIKLRKLLESEGVI